MSSIDSLSPEVSNSTETLAKSYLRNFANDLGLESIESIRLWAPTDYILFVTLSEHFYETLSKKNEFFPLQESALCRQIEMLRESNKVIRYKDSRSYLQIIHDYLSESFEHYNVIDIGGYLGRFSIEYSLMLKRLDEYSNRPVYCFEPSPMKHLLLLNLLVNKCQNVRHYPCAVSESDDQTEFFYNDRILISSRLSDFTGSTNIATVDCIKMETFLGQLPDSSRPTVAKIDVEGFEDRVIRGFGTRIGNLACAIVEYWPETFKKPFNSSLSISEYVFSNYFVLYIRNCLYPGYPMRQVSTTEELNLYLKGSQNIDILMINKNYERADSLLSALLNL